MLSIKNKKNKRPNISTFMIVLVTFSMCMITVFGWMSISQMSTNGLSGEAKELSVHLLKLEKDIDGNVTEIVIPNAEFYLYEVGDPDRQIGGRYVSDPDGKINVQLVPGNYYFVETYPSSSYTYDIDENGDAITRYPFTVTVDDADTAVVTAYNQRLSGSLIIEKTVRNEDGSDLSLEQLDVEFEFTVTFSDNGTYSYIIDGNPFSVASGGVIYLKHGQQAIFSNIPVGVTYTVVETPVLGYVIQSNNYQGSITTDGAIASFTNTYTTGTGKLTVTKSVTGIGADLDKEFIFTATIDGVEHTFPLKDGESMTFDKLQVGASYIVVEQDYSDEGYISTPSNYVGTIIDGEIILPFINHFDDGISNNGSLEISKTVVGNDIDVDKEFNFTITFDNLPIDPITILVDGEPVIISSTNNTFDIQLKHGESVLIEDIPDGVTYKVEEREELGYISGMSETEGTIITDQHSIVDFINQVIDETSLVVSKIIEGEFPYSDLNLEFEFVLEIQGQEPIFFTLKHGESQTFPNLPVGSVYIVREINIPSGYALLHVENGCATLIDTQITATFTNTYVDRIMIDITGTKYWDTLGYYPELPESITVHLKNGNVLVETIIVIPDAYGNWTYTFNAPKYDQNGNEIVYSIEEEKMDDWKSIVNGTDITNTYIPPIVVEGVTIKKEIIGDTPTSNTTFQFKMVGKDNAPMPQGSDLTNNSKSITIVGEGIAIFGDVTYTKEGVYVYTISELHTDETGYTYDTSIYTLTIEVQEVDGNLIVVSKTLTKDGNIIGEAIFTNRYSEKIANEKVTISGIKTWNHGGLASKYHPESIIVIVRKDNKIVLQREVSSSDQWRWTFILDKYDQNGNEIIYTIDEVSVPNYQKEIDGYNITNTYNPNAGTDNGNVDESNRSSNISTNDSTSGWFWELLLMVSAFMIGVIIIERKLYHKRNRKK